MDKGWAAVLLGGWLLIASGTVLVLASATCPGWTQAPEDDRIRTTDLPSASLLSDGLKRSQTVVKLAEHIKASDVVLYVFASPEPGTWRGATTFRSVAGGRRYLNVQISLALKLDERISVFAHELQHVCEVAARREIVSKQLMQELFEKIGYRNTTTGNHYETKAAQEVERRVRYELGQGQ